MLAEQGFEKAKEEWEKSVVQWGAYSRRLLRHPSLTNQPTPRAERRQERTKLEASGEGSNGVANSHEGSPTASDTQVTPMIGLAALEPRASLDDGGDHEDGAGGGKGKDSHPPAKRYRLTDQIKAIIWQLVCLSNECCRIENEKKCVARLSLSVRLRLIMLCFLCMHSVLEGSNQIVSDQGVRKTLYQKIVAAFPDGWLSSGQISREGTFWAGYTL